MGSGLYPEPFAKKQYLPILLCSAKPKIGNWIIKNPQLIGGLSLSPDKVFVNLVCFLADFFTIFGVENADAPGRITKSELLDGQSLHLVLFIQLIELVIHIYPDRLLRKAVCMELRSNNDAVPLHPKHALPKALQLGEFNRPGICVVPALECLQRDAEHADVLVAAKEEALKYAKELTEIGNYGAAEEIARLAGDEKLASEYKKMAILHFAKAMHKIEV